MRLRFGRFISLAAQMLGQVVSCKVPTRLHHHLIATMAAGFPSRFSRPPAWEAPTTRGATAPACLRFERYNVRRRRVLQFKPSFAESSAYSQAVNSLVTGAYLKPSSVLSHISRTDRLLRLEAELRRSHRGIPTAKDIVGWKLEAEAQVKRENDEAENVGMVRI
jgi:hypothetical protein